MSHLIYFVQTLRKVTSKNGERTVMNVDTKSFVCTEEITPVRQKLNILLEIKIKNKRLK
jgi:hypothetical protein